MKILIAIGVKRQKEAGAAGVVFNHAEQLQKLGHQVDTWFFDDLLPFPRWPARFQELEFAFAVSRRIRQSPAQYDVVNLHAPWGGVYGLSRKLWPSAAFPPYVFSMQGSEERYTRAMRFEQKKAVPATSPGKIACGTAFITKPCTISQSRPPISEMSRTAKAGSSLS